MSLLLCIYTEHVGTSSHLIFHTYGPNQSQHGKAYIQASLHADELPGLNYHLIHALLIIKVVV